MADVRRCRFSIAAAILAASGLLACTSSPPAQSVRYDAFPRAAWEQAENVQELGWSQTDIAALEPRVRAAGSAAFMIVTRGRIVAAWGDTAKTFWSHSVRKSLLSALIGQAVGEGKIDPARTLAELGIDEKAMPLTVDERRARVIDLLQARSGVYLPAAAEIDAMREARPNRGSHLPGTFWYYNNWDFNALGTIFRQSTGEDLFQAFERRIARPTRMQDYRVEEGVYGVEEPSEHAAFGFRLSARDLARFGLLYLHRGRWADRQVIPEAWVEASVMSYSTTDAQGSLSSKSGYGYMWWIQVNAQAHPELRLPDGSFTASGNGGQRLTVIPPIDTLVVNLMNTDEPGPRIDSSQWDALLADVLAARLLHPAIGPALPDRYTSVRAAQDWLNPYLAACPQGAVLSVRSLKRLNETVRIDALRATLVDLPLVAWPYGRVVALQDCSLGVEGDADGRTKRMENVEGVLKSLGLEVRRWPS